MAEAVKRERRADATRRDRRAGPDPKATAGPWTPPSAAGLASPALRLQQRLADEVTEERWPWSLTAAFVIGTCSAFWVMIYAVLRLLIG